MEFLIENWYIILAAMALGALAVVAVVRFFQLPREKQMENVRQWLLGAVTAAEKELGGGTGKLKLRTVYDAFLTKFPWLAPANGPAFNFRITASRGESGTGGYITSVQGGFQ